MFVRRQVRIGHLWVDAMSRGEALSAVRDLVEKGNGGAIFTPNVHHVVLAEDDAAFRAAYQRVDLALADGVPLLWAGRLLRSPIPAKLSGSDMILPLATLAAERGWGIHLVGGLPGAAASTAARLRELADVQVVGIDDGTVPVRTDSSEGAAIIARIRAARPRLVFVALGSPKQEVWIAQALEQIRPAVAIGVGAGFDFFAGQVRRAPAWVSRLGLEWLFRLSLNPRRLWRRYLLGGPRFIGIVWRTARLPRADRVR
jgi:N-acetylglucosaminyldiphosphoundecaprenol N-acetyl-beta-D-mannosaminyltransferase